MVAFSLSFPNLPEDVLRQIFEFAAYEDRCAAAHTLFLVNKAVKHWVQKIAYAIIILRTDDQVRHLSRTLYMCPHLSPFIRALSIHSVPAATHPCTPPSILGNSISTGSLPFLNHILRTCTSITAIYFNWPGYISTDDMRTLRSSLQSLSLKILYLTLGTFVDPNHTPIIFKKGITHLGILHTTEVFVHLLKNPGVRILDQSIWENLTHLELQAYHRAFFQSSITKTLYEDLDMSKNLKACTVYVADRGLRAEGKVEDERVVVLDREITIQDWLLVVEDWERSDAFFAGKVVEKRILERERKQWGTW